MNPFRSIITYFEGGQVPFRAEFQTRLAWHLAMAERDWRCHRRRLVLYVAVVFVATIALTVRCAAVPSAVTSWVRGDPQNRSWCQVANTGSMRPALDAGMVCLLERTTPADLRPGDIALYATSPDGKGEATISHRVVAVNRRGWVFFSGDHNRYSEGWIAPNRIRWRVARIIKP